MDVKAAQERLEQARKHKAVTWDEKVPKGENLGPLMSSELETTLKNIQRLAEERPIPKCQLCGVALKSLGIICGPCEEKQIRQEAERRHKERVENIEQHLAHIGIGKRYYACSFENFEGGEKYVSECRAFVEKGQNYSLFMTGTYGCGKTHLAVAICRELLLERQHPSIIFSTGAEILLRIRESFSREGSSEDSVVSKYSDPDVLVIDDMGAEKISDWARTTMYVIVDRRDRWAKSTVITSNLDLRGIEGAYGGRIASRIANSRIMKVNMEDYRKLRKRKDK